MRSDLFQHEVTKTSALFGRKSDVKVVFHGNMAATNGNTIYLPQLKSGKEVGEEAQEVMRGFVDHESGHVRHSDMPLVIATYERWAKEGRKLAKALHNALEDVWLERRVIAEYAGAERNLRATTKAVDSKALAMWRAKPEEMEKLKRPTWVTPFAITWEGRLPYGGETPGQMLALLPEEIRAKLPGYVKACLKCKNSKALIALAEKIEAELIEEAREEKREEKRKEREEAEAEKGESDESEAGEGSEESETDELDESGEAPEGEDEKAGGEPDEDDHDGVSPGDDLEEEDADRPEPESSETDMAEEDDGEPEEEGTADGEDPLDELDDLFDEAEGGDDEGEGERPSGETGEEDEVSDAELELDDVFDDFAVEDAVKDKLEDEKLSGRASRGEYRPWSTKEDRFIMAKPGSEGGDVWENHLAAGTAAAYERMLEQLVGPINVLRRGLERALAAKQTRDWDFGRVDGRLDARRFTAAMAGRDNVFKQRIERAEIDTAIEFVIDLSGSMGRGAGTKGSLAMQCAIALAEAVDRTGVSYEVVGFNQPLADGTKTEEMDRAGVLGRWEAIYTWVFKAFEQRLFEAKGPMSRIEACVGGNNADGESILLAYDRLRQRPEKRKVMFVLSDGAPYCLSDDHPLLQAHLRGAVKFIESQGVQVVAIGIQTDAPARFYGDWVQVDRIDQLGAEAMRLLSRVLLGDRRGVDRSRLIEGVRV